MSIMTMYSNFVYGNLHVYVSNYCIDVLMKGGRCSRCALCYVKERGVIGQCYTIVHLVKKYCKKSYHIHQKYAGLKILH